LNQGSDPAIHQSGILNRSAGVRPLAHDSKLVENYLDYLAKNLEKRGLLADFLGMINQPQLSLITDHLGIRVSAARWDEPLASVSL
jgi:hypothetical protein